MKEYHIFYAPELPSVLELPADEAVHAVRVLRLREGDALSATDGLGHLYDCRITEATPRRCRLEVIGEETIAPTWQGRIDLAVAPTKNIDRMEWLAEKATEIGFDSLTFLDCKNSERRVVKTERIEKILISAMKQSHKARIPSLEGMTRFDDYISRPYDGQRFICHCYAATDVSLPSPQLFECCDATSPSQVLIGPEGDFSIEEVERAIAAGYQPVSLGPSRLRTETAALVAVHLMFLKKLKVES